MRTELRGQLRDMWRRFVQRLNRFPWWLRLLIAIITVICIAAAFTIWIQHSNSISKDPVTNTQFDISIVLGMVGIATSVILGILSLSSSKATSLASHSQFPTQLQPQLSVPDWIIQHPGLSQPISSAWNVPYQRNSLFTGREEILKRLHKTLTAGKAVALTQAISGLGGIGKTQTAVEYAYRFGEEYKAVLWAGADSREVLVLDFVSIAETLSLPEKDAQDQSQVVEAVKRWLRTHEQWLLIFDNADDLTLLDEFLPSGRHGHILITTRSQATGEIAQQVEIDKMEPQEGALFLLRRAKIITAKTPLDKISGADLAKAGEISQAMDGLPLALDQAGAYIEEIQCTLSDYLGLYQARGSELRKWRGRFARNYPKSVATTWSLSFEKVQKADPAAAELLRLLAFLHPDAIPEEIIKEGAPELGPILQPVAADPIKLNEAIGELLKFSFIRRDPGAKTLSIHRLVQAVLADKMNKRTQRQWAERAIRAVNLAFPNVEFKTWQQCQRCLPQAQTCARLIEQWKMAFSEAARLLNQAAEYLQDRGELTLAEPFLQQALTIFEKVHGSEDSFTSDVRNNLALLYYAQGKYEQAELLLQQDLAINRKIRGPEHLMTASSLNGLGELYRVQGKYEQAKSLFKQAQAILENAVGPNHLDVAPSLNNLALLYYAQGKYEQAEPLFKRALAIWEKTLGADHPYVAQCLSNLALLYQAQGKYEQAEPLYKQAQAILEKAVGTEHPDLAQYLNNLAELYRSQGKYEQAEPLFKRALAILEKAVGTEHPNEAVSLSNLALLYQAQGKYAEAEPLFQRALKIAEQAWGLERLETIGILNALMLCYEDQGKHDQAEQLYQRSRVIFEKMLGPEHPMMQTSLENYIDLLRKTIQEQGNKGLFTELALENPIDLTNSRGDE